MLEEITALLEKYFPKEKADKYLPTAFVGVLGYFYGKKSSVKKGGTKGCLFYLFIIPLIMSLLIIGFFFWGMWYLWSRSKLPIWAKTLITIGILIFFIAINVVDNSVHIKNTPLKVEQSNVKAQTSTSQKVKNQVVTKSLEQQIKMPKEQIKFIEIVESFYSDYKNASNELKESALRAKRKLRLASLLNSLEIRNWIGKLDDMGTNSEGKAYVSIVLYEANSISIKTWDNSLSDVFTNSLIKNGSNVYNQIAELSEGDLVKFSGKFIKADEDYILERSITESGSMLAPEFIIKFTSVRKY